MYKQKKVFASTSRMTFASICPPDREHVRLNMGNSQCDLGRSLPTIIEFLGETPRRVCTGVIAMANVLFV